MEVWKDIVGYEGLYQVSNLGNVKSLKKGKEIIRKLTIDKIGYLYVELCKNSKGIKYKVHRLVAMAFIENPHNKPNVNHINGIKTDNKVENLEWCTQKENMSHATVNRLLSTKLNNIQVLMIREDNRLHREIAKDYNVCRQLIGLIKQRKIWTHI